jgi:hypothetical protein
MARLANFTMLLNHPSVPTMYPVPPSLLEHGDEFPYYQKFMADNPQTFLVSVLHICYNECLPTSYVSMYVWFDS